MLYSVQFDLKYILYTILLYKLTFLLQNVHGGSENLIIQTKVGTIRGLKSDDGIYNMFMGIPYATINKSNVFGDSVPYPPFDGVFEAYDDSVTCPQIEEFNLTAVGSLDCLHLNIYVPNTNNSQNRYPVLAYIYGGSFLVGFAGRLMYGPEYLVRHEVILLTFNYRLGPYGFMCLDTPEVPGNAGMKDQDKALRWINDNIEYFGGDPNRITLFGNSAGAYAVGLHLVSDSEKIFNNVIMQSGSALSPNLFKEGDVNAPLKIAAAMGFSTTNIPEALAVLSSADTHTVIKASVNITFGVCVEKQYPGVKRFLTDYPVNLNMSKVRGSSILQGYNSNEWLMAFVNLGPNSTTDPELLFELQLKNNFDFHEEDLVNYEQIVRHFYISHKEMNYEVKNELTHFLNVFWSIYPPVRSIAKYFDSDLEKVYQYVFSYDGGSNFIKVRDNITGFGANHADEIGYLFKMKLNFMPNKIKPEDQLIIDRMTAMWTNFAKYGNPTPETNKLLPVKWTPITKNSPFHYLDINTEMAVGTSHLHEQISFWDLFYKVFEKYEKGYRDINKNEDQSGDAGICSSSIYFSIILGFIIIMRLF